MYLYPLKYCLDILYHLMVLFWRWRWCTVDVLHCRGVPPFYCGFYHYFLLLVRSLKKQLVLFPILEVIRLLYLISDVFVEHPHLCQKGDPFGYHHGVGNCLESSLREFSPLFQLFNQSSKELRGVVWPHNLDCVLLDVDLVHRPVSGEKILEYGECRQFYETHQLVHHWGQEDWFHHCYNLLFQSSVHGGVRAKQRLVLSELFSSERLFLGATHALRLVAWVVRRHKREYCLFHVLFGRHRQRKVSVSDSSKVQRHIRRIPTDQSMDNDQYFYC